VQVIKWLVAQPKDKLCFLHLAFMKRKSNHWQHNDGSKTMALSKAIHLPLSPLMKHFSFQRLSRAQIGKYTAVYD